MLKIRLQRTGKRGQAYFRVVVLEHTTKPKGKYLEFLGSYDPHKNELSVKEDRIKYWLSVGASLSETVNNLLVGKGVIEGEKVKVWKPKKKKKEIAPQAAPTVPAPATEAPVEESKTKETPASEETPPAPPEGELPKPEEPAKPEEPLKPEEPPKEAIVDTQG